MENAINNSGKLFDLAKNELAKDEQAKALDSLSSAVEDNKLEFINAIHLQKKRVKEALIVIERQNKTPRVSPNEIVEARLVAKALQAELDALEEVFNERF